MITLFELLNLPDICGFIWVPVYLNEDRNWCRVWEWQIPNVDCAWLKSCIDSTFLSTFIAGGTGLIWTVTPTGLEFEVDPLYIDANVNSTWLAPVLTVWTQSYNLSQLLLTSNVYRSISDQLQRWEHRPPYIIGNKKTLQIDWIDGIRHFFDSDPASPTFEHWVVGLLVEFVTTPLWAPSIYDYEYRVTAGQDYYNPRRYVLTWYTTFAIDWVNRNCGRAVWAEPQCCMQTLVVNWCMLWLGGGDWCNGRCQTIRDQINGTERVNICNVFDQQLSYTPNLLCIEQPGNLLWNIIEFSNVPPPAPAVWDAYIVSAIGVWDWLWHDNERAVRDWTVWTFDIPVLNDSCYDMTNHIQYRYNGVTWSTTQPTQCVDISETNNHYLLTYPGSESMNYILELYNTNGILQTQLNLDFMNDQQLIYNTIPVTPQPAHPVPVTINNTLSITQPFGLTQSVDLNRVNNQIMTLTPEGYLIINSQLDPQNDCDLGCDGRILDMREYFEQWSCATVCNCVMDSVPDWSSLVTVTPGGFRDTFLATNPSVYEVMYMLRSRYVINFNRVWPLNITWRNYERPCGRFSDTLDTAAVPQEMCTTCCEPCWGGGWSTTDIIQSITSYVNNNITLLLEEKKYYAKRWIGKVPATPNYIEIQQPFNGVLDPGGGAEYDNIWWYDFGSWFDQRYWYDPVSMTASQMTIEPSLMANSAIKCIKKGIYEMFIDWPIWVNHFVHAFRIALIVERDGKYIILNDWKIWGDPFSWSGSVNNWYFKENKFYYVSSYKNVELLYWDIITCWVKIDANTSRPYLDQDPMTLGWYNNPASTRDSWSRPFDSGRTGNNWTWIQYGQSTDWNFPGDTGFARQQYNGYSYNSNTSIDVSSVSCSYCSHDHTLDPNPHTHTNYIMLPAIPPHAPNYINALPPSSYPLDGAVMWYVAPVAEWDRPSLLYPGRYMKSNTNGYYGSRQDYQPGTWVIRFIGPSTGWDNWTTYPAMPPYWATFPYNEIASSTWFMFGIRRQQWVWNSQIEDFS